MSVLVLLFESLVNINWTFFGSIKVARTFQCRAVWRTNGTSFVFWQPLSSGRHRVKTLIWFPFYSIHLAKLKPCLHTYAWCLLASLTSYHNLTRVTGDIVLGVNELKEVKTLYVAFLELGWLMPRSGSGATPNIDPLEKDFLPPPPAQKKIPPYKKK